MSTNNNAMNQHIASLRKKASVLGHDVEDLGAISKEIAGDAMDTLQTHATQYYDQGVKKAVRLEKNLEKKISDNPLRALLIAAGVGVLAGTIMNRR